MWTMAKSSIALFFQGRLFAEPSKAMRQLLLGIILTAIVLIGASIAEVPIWAAALLAGFIGGAFQPFFFRNLRYR